MTDEQKLLKSYRLADDRGKASILDHAVSTAEDWPNIIDELQLTHSSSAPVGLACSELKDLVPSPVIRPAE